MQYGSLKNQSLKFEERTSGTIQACRLGWRSQSTQIAYKQPLPVDTAQCIGGVEGQTCPQCPEKGVALPAGKKAKKVSFMSHK